MSKRNQLITITNLVKDILEADVQSRNSDCYLYLKVIEYIAAQKGLDLKAISVPYFLQNINDLGFPPMKSVTRARRKLQRAYPDLRGCEAVEEARAENEMEYIGYSRSAI